MARRRCRRRTTSGQFCHSHQATCRTTIPTAENRARGLFLPLSTLLLYGSGASSSKASRAGHCPRPGTTQPPYSRHLAARIIPRISTLASFISKKPYAYHSRTLLCMTPIQLDLFQHLSSLTYVSPLLTIDTMSQEWSNHLQPAKSRTFTPFLLLRRDMRGIHPEDGPFDRNSANGAICFPDCTNPRVLYGEPIICAYGYHSSQTP